MRIASLKHTDGDGRETVRPVFIIDSREDLVKLFADAEAGKTGSQIAAACSAAEQPASPNPDSLNIIASIHSEVRQGLKIKSVSETELHVRFFDVDHPVDDLPVIICNGKSWLPYCGARVREGDRPGYHVEYTVEGSMSVRAMGRIGKSNGQVLDLTELPAKRERRDSWVWSQTSEEDRAKLNKTQQDALRFGYVRGAGDRWYASGPGKPELPRRLGLEVHIESPTFAPGEQHSIQDTWPIAVYGQAYGRTAGMILMMRFESWARFVEFVEGLTTISPGGQPGNDVTNVWD